MRLLRFCRIRIYWNNNVHTFNDLLPGGCFDGVCRDCCSGGIGGSRFFLFGFEPGGEGVEVAAEHYADALGGGGGADIVVLVIVAVVCFQAPCPLGCEQVLNVEVSDELVGVQRFVAVAEVAVEQQSVVEQTA